MSRHEAVECPTAWRINFQQVQMPSRRRVENLSRHPRSQNVIRLRWKSDTENYLCRSTTTDPVECVSCSLLTRAQNLLSFPTVSSAKLEISEPKPRECHGYRVTRDVFGARSFLTRLIKCFNKKLRKAAQLTLN